MVDDNGNRKRRSIRLLDYDYGREGAYFVTLCVHDRGCLFGEIVDGAMQLNECGALVASEWSRTTAIRPQVVLDEFVVMPNHFHAVIAIADSRRGVLPYARPSFDRRRGALAAIVRGFKSATTKTINSMRKSPGAPVWQRNYYEHVVRNDEELQRIREYIMNNPLQWSLDWENPEKGVYQYAPTDGIEAIFGGIRP